MSEGLAEFIKSLPNLALKLGFILFIVGGAGMLGLATNVIQPTALGGYVADAAPTITVGGAALFLCGLVFEAKTLWSFLGDARASKAARDRNEARILDNINYLEPNAKLFLYSMLMNENMRMPVIHHCEPFEQLYRLNIVQAENVWALAQGGLPDGFVTVVPAVANRKAQLIPALKASINKTDPIDLDNSSVVNDALRVIIIEEQRQRGLPV